MRASLLTIVTYRRRVCLGRIVNAAFEPSPLGRCVASVWTDVTSRHTTVRVHGFQLMPDHLHAVIECVGGGIALPDLVRLFKSTCTREAHRNHHIPATTPLWQRSYHDRWLTSAVAVCRAIRYVEANPSQAAKRRKTSR